MRSTAGPLSDALGLQGFRPAFSLPSVPVPEPKLRSEVCHPKHSIPNLRPQIFDPKPLTPGFQPIRRLQHIVGNPEGINQRNREFAHFRTQVTHLMADRFGLGGLEVA